ncbi:MAG: protein kinase [Candidatus Pacebacteria bacterium]|nr:protein kinase [Candidatus Paceibacterota bacterium]
MRFFEYYQDAMNYYLVTEYCEGGDLLSKLRVCRKLAESTAAGVIKQILAAVEYCHKNNIIHRYFCA